MSRFYWDYIIDVYENITTVKLYNECEEYGAGCLSTVILECVINVGNSNPQTGKIIATENSVALFNLIIISIEDYVIHVIAVSGVSLFSVNYCNRNFGCILQ